MAKKQTRRGVSLNRVLYEQAKAAADLAGVPLSQFTSDALRTKIAKQQGLGCEPKGDVTPPSLRRDATRQYRES